MKDGGPAFPCPSTVYDPDTHAEFDAKDWGMSLRDYFAGQALAGIYANPESRHTYEEAATVAYRTADAMIAAREAQP